MSLLSSFSSLMSSATMSVHQAVAGALDKVMLNPQPLPPGEVSLDVGHALDHVSLNPQPLPPREVAFAVLQDFDGVELNPQPLPPKELVALVGAWSDEVAEVSGPHGLPPSPCLEAMTSLAGEVSLNPQPLPPEPPPEMAEHAAELRHTVEFDPPSFAQDLGTIEHHSLEG